MLVGGACYAIVFMTVHDLIYSTSRLVYIEVGGFGRGYEFEDFLTLTPECQQMVSGQCQKVSKLVSHDLWCQIRTFLLQVR